MSDTRVAHVAALGTACVVSGGPESRHAAFLNDVVELDRSGFIRSLDR